MESEGRCKYRYEGRKGGAWQISIWREKGRGGANIDMERESEVRGKERYGGRKRGAGQRDRENE